MLIERYEPTQREPWNEFVGASRNGTFLLDRGYMDYHQDRFVDHSLILRSDNGRIAALLPANEANGALHSHAGLTYGGLIVGEKSGAGAMLEMFEALRTYLRANALASLRYKTIPSIYHRQPAEEDRYALFRCGATLTRRDVLSVVPRTLRLRYQERRSRGVKSAAKAGIEVVETTNYTPFWDVLDRNLRERYGVAPVHSLAEIELLHGRFPEAIRLFVAQRDRETLAGALVYESTRVAHVQYISASETGKQSNALDAVFDHLLTRAYADKDWFDFGISNEENGQVLNSGLVEQKEGFGARTMVHDYYELAA
jgi:hypothetical protein